MESTDRFERRSMGDPDEMAMDAAFTVEAARARRRAYAEDAAGPWNEQQEKGQV